MAGAATSVGFVGAHPAAGAEVATVGPATGHVLVISVPGLTWDDIDTHALEHLGALLDDSAVANLAVRVERLATQPGDGYATMGAGTRAFGPSDVAGLALEPDEQQGIGRTAAEEFERRTAHPLTSGVGVLAIDEIAEVNEEGLFEGTPGALGDALAAVGIDRGVVANADTQPFDAALRERRREAALGVMTSDGYVPCGAVSDALLRDDPRGPFGYRYDTAAVVDAYARCRTDRSVVLVEASELRRARSYEPSIARDERDARWRAALTATDELVGALLERTEPDDAIVVVGPSAPGSTPRLMVFGVHGGGYSPGLLESASTRQPGYVVLPDVAPTIAAIAGAPIDVDELAGRAVTIARSGGNAADRLHFLVDGDAAARFRDRMQAPIATALIALASIFSILVALRFLKPNWKELPIRLLEAFAVAILTIPTLTYLIALVPMHRYGAAVYSLAVFGTAAVVGGVIGRWHRRWLVPIAVPLVSLLLVIATSVVLLESRLQLSTVFGDSPIIAGRFSGINNVTFSQIIVAAILLGAMLVHAVPKQFAFPAMIVLFVAVLAVDVAPMWGADVGGILAGLPALAFAAMLLAGWRIRLRAFVIAAVATLGALTLLGLLDLSRDPSSRTHLGRLFERIGSDGLAGLTTVVNRKLAQNLRTLTDSVWRFILIPVLLSAVIVAWSHPRPFVALRERFAPFDRMLGAIAIAALLGYALNDSGIAIPGMMLGTLAPAVGYMLLRVER